jgi:hypothetical protein
MGGSQAIRHPREQFDNLSPCAKRMVRTRTQPVFKRPAIYKFSNQILQPFNLANFVNRQDVRVVQKRSRLRLTTETAERLGGGSLAG